LPVQLTGKVARTAHDRDHINKLQVPYFGIQNLQLSKGTAISKLHLANYAQPKTPARADGTDDFHFASSLPADKIKIEYALDNPFAVILTAKFELFRRYSDKQIWTRDLKDGELTDGDHTLEFGADKEWDGTIGNHADFPDDVVTVEHSPYKLKLTVTGDGRSLSPVAWTYFHVLVKEIDPPELGPQEALSNTVAEQKHRDVRTRLASVPPEGTTSRVYLPSNIFEADGERHDQLFTEYQTVWSDGPRIPVFAKVWIRDSGDNKVDAPKALGNVKFLWDWEAMDEDTSAQHAKAKKFLDYAKNYQVKRSKPMGETCHDARGGKRGAATRVLLETAGYPPKSALTDGDFPFKAEATADKRLWAVYSYAWTTGILAGKTGVLFQPARMAGDHYKLTIYLAWDTKPDGTVVLNVKDKVLANATIKKSTGIFEIWRRTAIVKYVQKVNTLATFTVATVQGYYEKAFLDVQYLAGAPGLIPGAAYAADVPAAASGLPKWWSQMIVDTTVDQYTVGNYAVYLKDYATYTADLQAHATAPAPGGLGWPVPKFNRWLAKNAAIRNANQYHASCKEWSKGLVRGACNKYVENRAGHEGVTILQFDGLYNQQNQPGGIVLNGYSDPKMPAHGRNHCVFIQCGGAADYGGDSNTLEQTVTHEIGHHMFLPHTKDSGENVDYHCHDIDWKNCTMSYNFDQERRFCGFCILRMRGWSKNALNVNGKKNKKT
jgi:hypothetical protein